MLTIPAGPSTRTWRWWGAAVACVGAAMGVLAFGWPRVLALAALIAAIPLALIAWRQTARTSATQSVLHCANDAIAVGKPFRGFDVSAPPYEAGFTLPVV